MYIDCEMLMFPLNMTTLMGLTWFARWIILIQGGLQGGLQGGQGGSLHFQIQTCFHSRQNQSPSGVIFLTDHTHFKGYIEI